MTPRFYPQRRKEPATDRSPHTEDADFNSHKCNIKSLSLSAVAPRRLKGGEKGLKRAVKEIFEKKGRKSEKESGTEGKGENFLS